MEVRVSGAPRATVQTPSPANPLQDSFLKLEQAENLRLQGKLDQARSICEALVRRHPDYMGALHTLGLVYADKKNYERALDYLVRAAMLNPRNWTTLTALSGVYLRLGANEMAAHALEQARRFKPRDANVLITLGEIYREEREYERSRDAYRGALECEPDSLVAGIGLGWMFAYLGQHTEAAKVFESFIARGACSVDLAFGLANLPRSVVTVDVVAELDKAVKSEADGADDLMNFTAFAQAGALDRAGRYAEAWQHLVPANRASFQTMRSEFEEDVRYRREDLAAMRAYKTKVARAAVGPGPPVSLFILGTSRSGKTTMEQLVATLDGVKRGYENPIVENAIRRTFQTSALLTSNYFGNLPPPLDEKCRDIYLDELAERAGQAKVFTNTHPGRISDAARIAGAFPNARFILVKRNLEDTLLRIYMQRYNKGHAYSYDLKAAREYILWYHEMIDMVAAKLPEITRVIRYEDMIVDPAGALRTAAELCGLPMSQGPLPDIGDDRGCAAPYRQFMAEALSS
jgi:tetratricopeptide (TPR) repeat protein